MGWGIYLFIVGGKRQKPQAELRMPRFSGASTSFACKVRGKVPYSLFFFFLLCVVVLTSITSIDPQTSYSCIKHTLEMILTLRFSIRRANFRIGRKVCFTALSQFTLHAI